MVEQLESSLPSKRSGEDPKPPTPPNAQVEANVGSRGESKLAGRKRKHTGSVFRIKTGCVVALRMGVSHSHDAGVAAANNVEIVTPATVSSNGEHESNGSKKPQHFTTIATMNLSKSNLRFIFVWTAPMPGRDCHWALVGQRVRCSLPKQKKPKISHVSVIEGEVIRYCGLDHGDCGTSGGFAVDLLVDQNLWEHLSATRSDASMSSQQRGWRIVKDDENLSTRNQNDTDKRAKARRRQLVLEDRIQGDRTKIVRVFLKDAEMPGAAPVSRGVVCEKRDKCGLRWVIQKRVPSKLFHERRSKRPRSSVSPQNETATCVQHATTKDPSQPLFSIDTSAKLISVEQEEKTPNAKSSFAHQNNNGDGIVACAKKNTRNKHTNITGISKHIGDGNDSTDQQIANWRWLAGKYHDMLWLSTAYNACKNELSNGFAPNTQSTLDMSCEKFLSSGMIGEVVRIDANATITPNTKQSTLAMVTFRRLFLTQHTATGIFAGADNHSNDGEEQWNQVHHDADKTYVRIPIEGLVMIGKGIQRHSTSIEINGRESSEDMVEQSGYMYSLPQNTYTLWPQKECSNGTTPTEWQTKDGETERSFVCHRCRRISAKANCQQKVASSVQHNPRADLEGSWCSYCQDLAIAASKVSHPADQSCSTPMSLRCEGATCDCRLCVAQKGHVSDSEIFELLSSSASKSKSPTNAYNGDMVEKARVAFLHPFQVAACTAASSPNSIQFGLPSRFFELQKMPIPQTAVALKVKPRKQKVQSKRSATLKQRSKPAINGTTARKLAKKSENVEECNIDSTPLEDYSVFKSGSAREIAYNSSITKLKSHLLISVQPVEQMETPRNMREVEERNNQRLLVQNDETTKDTSSSRAARVSQRRLLKDVVSSLGSTTGLGFVVGDTLASREAQLRFDRSSIHAWGVFTDVPIAADEMIVEYRGELIGNAVAERREIEYEAANIGSDYMFRVDALNVCDATKQGNVARFLNASCDPNCYTKIITLGGTKRIVIYAKKDINSGDELCYDYKFPVEYDPGKRILCHCGARECRGFMNWDKRYVLKRVPTIDCDVQLHRNAEKDENWLRKSNDATKISQDPSN